MSTEEYAALGALAVLFFVVAFFVRRRPRRKKDSPNVSPEYFAEFETQAHDIALQVLEHGRDRLRKLRSQLEPEHAALQEQLAFIRGLNQKLGELRASSAQGEERHHEWDYLAASATGRYPWLSPWLAELDQPMLKQAAASAQQLVTALAPLFDSTAEQLSAAEALLAEEPTLIWTQIDLIVLTLLLTDPDDAHQLAATRHLELRPKRPGVVQKVRDALTVALDLMHAVPRTERVAHDDLLVPPLANLDLAAALVRHRVARATDRDDLVRARALLLGDPDLLWLALAVVEKTAYPKEAAKAYGRLAALVRQLLKGDADSEETEASLGTAARELFDAEQTAALVETARQLRAGRRPEELFAAVDFAFRGSR